MVMRCYVAVAVAFAYHSQIDIVVHLNLNFPSRLGLHLCNSFECSGLLLSQMTICTDVLLS